MSRPYREYMVKTFKATVVKSEHSPSITRAIRYSMLKGLVADDRLDELLDVHVPVDDESFKTIVEMFRSMHEAAAQVAEAEPEPIADTTYEILKAKYGDK